MKANKELKDLLEQYAGAATDPEHKKNVEMASNFLDAMEQELPSEDEKKDEVDQMMGALDPVEEQDSMFKDPEFKKDAYKGMILIGRIKDKIQNPAISSFLTDVEGILKTFRMGNKNMAKMQARELALKFRDMQ